MSKVLVLDWLHHKNKNGLTMLFKKHSIDHKFGTVDDIKDYDIIYSPSEPIDTSKYPSKKIYFRTSLFSIS